MMRFKHYTIAVHDLESAVQNYKNLFGMDALTEPQHNNIGNFDSVSMGYDGKPVLQLIQSSSDDTPVARLMRDRMNEFNPHGEGVYLLAFEADDPDELAGRIESHGGRITRIPGSTNFFVHPTSSNFGFMEIFPPAV
jgi:predicted enzyme related to lactoylglutathione lyase